MNVYTHPLKWEFRCLSNGTMNADRLYLSSLDHGRLFYFLVHSEIAFVSFIIGPPAAHQIDRRGKSTHSTFDRRPNALDIYIDFAAEAKQARALDPSGHECVARSLASGSRDFDMFVW